MEAEKNKVFIDCVSVWLGGTTSFSEMNRRLPKVAAAIQQHDTTGMAESFEQISKRLKSLLLSVGSSYPDGSNILIVTNAFLIKTAIYLYDFGNIEKFSRISNTDSIRLLFDLPHNHGQNIERVLERMPPPDGFQATAAHILARPSAPGSAPGI